MTISYSDGTVSVLRRWKGSVYKSVLKQLIAYLILWYFIRIIYFYALADNQQKTFEHIVKTFATKMKSSFTLTFILGFYVNAVVGRWWSQIQLIVWPDDLVSFTGFIFNDQERNTKIKRHQISRYLVLTCCLVFRDISSRVMKRFPTIDHFVKAGLMTTEECELYDKCGEKSGRWMLPLEWIIKLLRQRMDENQVAPPLCAAYIQLLNAYRDNLRRMFLYDWINIPLVYTQVAAIATYSYFALTLIVRQYLDHNKNIPEYEMDMYFPIFTVLEFVFYVGWFKVGQELMKPWGEDDDDAELNFILDRHLNVAFSLSDVVGAAACPSPMEDKFWLVPKTHTSLSLPHTKQSRKISEHMPKRYVAPSSSNPTVLDMTKKTLSKFKPRIRDTSETESVSDVKMKPILGYKRPSLNF